MERFQVERSKERREEEEPRGEKAERLDSIKCKGGTITTSDGPMRSSP